MTPTTQIPKLPNIHRVSTAKVRALQQRLRDAMHPNYWKEGMSDSDIDKYFDDMVQLLRHGQLRYWPEGDSYVIHDFTSTLTPSYNVYCISREYFLEKIVPRLYKL